MGAVGTSLSLISPAEDKSHSKIVEALKVKFNKVLMDGRLMSSAQERTSLATKIVIAGEIDQKTNSQNKWFLDAAKEADLELDDDLLEDESNRSEKDQLQLKEAKKAKLRLEKLQTAVLGIPNGAIYCKLFHNLTKPVFKRNPGQPCSDPREALEKP